MMQAGKGRQAASEKLFRAAAVVLTSLLFVFVPASHAGGGGGRKADVVSIRGGEVPSLLGVPLEKIGGYAVRDGGFKVAPRQIDERLKDGTLIYTTYRGGATSVLDGKLAAADEVLFMLQDAGERRDGEPLPPGAVGGVELRVVDPLGGPEAWFYLLEFEAQAPRSDTDYVAYDPEKDWVTARYYTVGFPYRGAIQVPSYFACTEEAGGTGENIYDIYKVRLTIDLKLFPTLVRSQDDFVSRPFGYVDGPVRVSRRVKTRLRMVGPIKGALSDNDSYFYPYYCSFPSRLEIPFSMGFIAHSASLRITDDLSGGAEGMMWYSDRNPGGVAIDGKPGPEEKDIDRGPFRWKLVTGPQGTLMNLTIFDPKLEMLDKKLYFCDDKSEPDGPEQFPGQIANQGFELANLECVPKGVYSLAVYVFCPVDYEKGDEEMYFNSVVNPLTVSATPLPRGEEISAGENDRAVSTLEGQTRFQTSTAVTGMVSD